MYHQHGIVDFVTDTASWMRCQLADKRSPDRGQNRKYKTALAGAKTVVNPMAEKESVQEIDNELGICMEIPEGATDVKYYMIAEETGHIDFTFQGNVITFCSSIKHADTEFHDVCGDPLDGKVSVTLPEGTYAIYTYPEGGRLVTWSNGDVNYSLYTCTSASDDTIASVLEVVTAL